MESGSSDGGIGRGFRISFEIGFPEIFDDQIQFPFRFGFVFGLVCIICFVPVPVRLLIKFLGIVLEGLG